MVVKRDRVYNPVCLPVRQLHETHEAPVGPVGVVLHIERHVSRAIRLIQKLFHQLIQLFRPIYKLHGPGLQGRRGLVEVVQRRGGGRGVDECRDLGFEGVLGHRLVRCSPGARFGRGRVPPAQVLKGPVVVRSEYQTELLLVLVIERACHSLKAICKIPEDG